MTGTTPFNLDDLLKCCAAPAGDYLDRAILNVIEAADYLRCSFSHLNNRT